MQEKETAKNRPTEEAKPYVDTLKAMEEQRSEYEDEYVDITQYILPRKGIYFDRGDKMTEKRKKVKIVDPTAREACRFAAGGILGGMTPKSRPWLRLSLRDDNLMKYGPVKEWFHHATVKMLEIFAWTNTYTALYSVFKELVSFGTACMLEEEDFDKLIRFFTFTAGEYYLAVNNKGIVDTFYRRYKMTAQNIVKEFGESGLEGEIIKASKEDSKKLSYYDICHCIQPNKSRDIKKIDYMNMPFESVYWQHNKTQKIIHRSGYHEFPILAPRWDTTTTQSVYGEGPGQDMLGLTKMLQELNIGQIKAIHQETTPAMRIPPNYEGRLSLLPGAQNIDPTLSAGGNGKGIDRLFSFNFDMQGVSSKIDDTRTKLLKGFFNDLFRMTIDDGRNQPATAREIAERHEEKMVLLSPILERTHTELLNPMVERTFNTMLRNRALPPAPPEIEGQEIKVELTSILAQAQKLIGLQAIDTYLMFLGNAITLQPNILDGVNFDEMRKQYGDSTGIDPKIEVPDDKVAEIRDQRAKQQQAQQALEMAQVGSGVAKDLGQAGAEEGTMLEELREEMTQL